MEVAQQKRPRRIFFIDSENGIDTLIDGCQYLELEDEILLFVRGEPSDSAKAKLGQTRAKIEQIKCLDPGVKNSMDVQIIAEFTMRFALDDFEGAYIISRDHGYLPAIHYLQRHAKGRNIELVLADSIKTAVIAQADKALSRLQHASSIEDVKRVLAAFLGREGAQEAVGTLKSIMAAPDDASNATSADASPTPPALERLEALKGIGPALAQKLTDAGITSAKQFREEGAVGAWKRVHATDGSFPARWVYVFEGALCGCSQKELTADRKSELAAEIRKCGITPPPQHAKRLANIAANTISASKHTHR
ncbi:TfoX/Sxy family DNA transformation protein [Xiamenia xianingshaonis]|uniref:TfoX/Sxy family DNA transformation protein n=1 Tax=Xiamenia xianingshaonis TaxID=2682776 RepID=UPI001409D762|nr:TfoX/Sxy family DNA transformation protein [Xiamenia xianingshaonis]